MAESNVRSLYLREIQSGVTISGFLNLVMILLTNTKSFSSGLSSLLGYLFPSGATRPAALYLGIKIHLLSGSSPCSYL